MQRDSAPANHLSKRPAKQRVVSDHPLLKREEWLRLAAESAGIGLWYWNEVAWDLFWDQKSREIFGVNMDGPVLLDAFYEALHPDDVKRVRKVWRSQLERGLPYQLEYRTKRPDGGIRWVNARGSGYYAKDGSPLRMVGVHVDVTEHKTSERERLQLSGRLINAQEEERARLARELHDDFAQRMALVHIELDSLAQVTENSLARKRLSELKEEVQGIGDDLHPSQCATRTVAGVLPMLAGQRHQAHHGAPHRGTQDCSHYADTVEEGRRLRYQQTELGSRLSVSGKSPFSDDSCSGSGGSVLETLGFESEYP